MKPRWQAEVPLLVLASGSAARRTVLSAAGVTFEAVAAAVDEAAVKDSAQSEGMTAEETAILLAEMKARHVALRRPGALVIGCDQILVCEGMWFDKPDGMEGARMQLRALRGKRHVLATSVVCWRDGRRVWQHVARPELVMREFSEEFLDAYLAAEGDAVLGSVGAYRLEGPGVQLFDSVTGEHAAVLGLPLLPLLGFLRQHGLLVG